MLTAGVCGKGKAREEDGADEPRHGEREDSASGKSASNDFRRASSAKRSNRCRGDGVSFA